MVKANYTDSVIDELINESYYSKYLDPKFCYSPTGKEADDFYFGLKHNYIDIDAFHAAFDEELNDLDLLYLFDNNGLLVNKATYGEIKKYLNVESAFADALLKLWSAQFNYMYKTKQEKIADVKKELAK